jgi:hypothetical protein
LSKNLLKYFIFIHNQNKTMNIHIKQLTSREAFESRLLANFRNIKIFEPQKDCPLVDRFKDGTFGFSNTAITLYYHGNNPRGLSQIAPFGLLWNDGRTIFPFAYFKKEGEENDRGYLMVGHPKGEDALGKMTGFVKEVLNATQDICNGAYVRFLPEGAFKSLEAAGFQRVGSNSRPWHPNAPMEDETRQHSIVQLSELIEPGQDGFRIRNIFNERTQKNDNHRRSRFNCFVNFLARNGLEYIMEKFNPDGAGFAEQQKAAESLIHAHFASLEERGKAVGSVWQDYVGEISPKILSLPNVHAYMGYLCKIGGKKVPVSVFVAEDIGQRSAGHYVSITTYRSENMIFDLFGINPQELVGNLPRLIKTGEPDLVPRNRGFMGIALYSMVTSLAKLQGHGFEVVKLGGSETADLDFQKEYLGARIDRTGWMYFGG